MLLVDHCIQQAMTGLGYNEWREMWERGAILDETEVLPHDRSCWVQLLGYYEGQPRWLLLLYLAAVHCLADRTDWDLKVK